MISILLSSLILTASEPTTPAPAAPAASATATVPAPEVPKKEREICKREPVSGSLHGSKRVCMTARQWRSRSD